MKCKTQADLFEKYQHRVPSTWYGFDGIPDVWVPKIDKLLEEIAVILPDFECHQCKEKFGGFRLYLGYPKETPYEIIDLIEQKIAVLERQIAKDEREARENYKKENL